MTLSCLSTHSRKSDDRMSHHFSFELRFARQIKLLHLCCVILVVARDCRSKEATRAVHSATMSLDRSAVMMERLKAYHSTVTQLHKELAEFVASETGSWRGCLYG